MKNIVEKIKDYALEEIMGERFSRYAKYIIQDRALPDVRDGLKPVQRRILYSMSKERNTYDKPYRKSAKTVGDVIGKYHPHGDTSIYEAMVRMSQSWKLKHPLIDMHGNNGSIDGDNPAAYRYTEVRLSKISQELLKDIDKETVLTIQNFDDTTYEPTVLPAKFPNLLINGSSGISAGYATNIPPHNIEEIIEATIKRIDSPNCYLETILDIVKGPDFPTGGIIEGIKGIKEAYQTGKGRIYIKSKIKKEKVKGKERLIVEEIPYEVNKASLVRKIDDIKIEKKIEGIDDVRDESDKDGLRIVIDLKKNANSELILNYLLKNTDLFVSYNLNMVAIVNRRPKLLGILDILDAYIKHQKEVILKRTRFDLNHAEARLHIVEGLIKAMSILDEIIKTIRSSSNKQDAEENLVEKFMFTNLQAKAIVMLQLYRLTNTDVVLLKEELNNLNIIIKGLKAILSDENILKKVIKEELKKIKKEYGIKRLTLIEEEITDLSIDETLMILKEDVIVIITNEGYVKRVSLRSYRALNEEETLLKDLDYIIGFYKIRTIDTILLFTNKGNYLYLPVHNIPEGKWLEYGKHISNIISISAGERIIKSIPVTNFEEELYITTFTKLGMVKRTKLKEYQALRYSKPLIGISLKENDEVISVDISNNQEVLMVTNNGYGLRYDISELNITGLRTSGVIGINLKDDYVINGLLFDQEKEYLTLITDQGTGKRIKLTDLESSKRNRRGLLLIRKVKSKSYKIMGAFILDTKEEIGLKTASEINILKITELMISDRYSTGNKISNKNIKDVFPLLKLITKEEKKEQIEMNLDEVDIKISSVNDILKDIDN
ncbi:MAG: DNA topoisomerase IV subunit A [Bacilli bacterium]|jgi:topoisomerase-4 subunit A